MAARGPRANQAGMPIGRYLVGLALNTPNEPDMDAPAPPRQYRFPMICSGSWPNWPSCHGGGDRGAATGTAWEAEINSIQGAGAAQAAACQCAEVGPA